MTTTLTIFLMLAIASVSTPSYATSVYMCTDDEGNVTFQQNACGARQTEQFRGDYSDTDSRVGTFVNENNAQLLRDARERGRRLEQAKRRAGYGVRRSPGVSGGPYHLPGTGVQEGRHDPAARRLRMDREQQRRHELDMADRLRPTYVVPGAPYGYAAPVTPRTPYPPRTGGRPSGPGGSSWAMPR